MFTNSGQTLLQRIICFTVPRSYIALSGLFWVTIASADALSLKDLGLQPVQGEGRVVLQDLQPAGNWLLVKIWSADCPVCASQVSMLNELTRDVAARDIAIVGVSLDTPQVSSRVEHFLQQYEPDYPSYFVNSQKLSELYTRVTGDILRGTPTYLLFSPVGELVGNNPGAITRQSVLRFITRYNSFELSGDEP